MSEDMNDLLYMDGAGNWAVLTYPRDGFVPPPFIEFFGGGSSDRKLAYKGLRELFEGPWNKR